jgi:hypothetical protein
VRETVVLLVEAVSNKMMFVLPLGVAGWFLMQGGFVKEVVGYEGTSK